MHSMAEHNTACIVIINWAAKLSNNKKPMSLLLYIAFLVIQARENQNELECKQSDISDICEEIRNTNEMRPP